MRKKNFDVEFLVDGFKYIIFEESIYLISFYLAIIVCLISYWGLRNSYGLDVEFLIVL